MTIEFLLDDMSDKDKKKIKEIIKTLKYKRSKPLSREALFLRKFTLALMRKYNKPAKKMELPKLKVSISKILQQQFEAPSPIGFFSLETPEPLELENIPEPLTILNGTQTPVPLSLGEESRLEYDLETPLPIDIESIKVPEAPKLKAPDPRSVNEEIRRKIMAPTPN